MAIESRKKAESVGIMIGSMRTGAGGAEKQAVFLSTLLKSHYCVHFVVMDGRSVNPRLHNHLTEAGVKCHFLTGSLPVRWFKLWKVLVSNRFGYLFCYLTAANFSGGILGRITRVRWIIGSIRSSRLSTRHYFVQKIAHNYLTHYTIFNNERGAAFFRSKGFSAAKMHVIHNGIQPESQFYSRNAKKRVTLATVGRFVPEKDFYTALKAVSIAVQQTGTEIDLRYLIAGFGSLETQIRSWIHEFSLEAHAEVILHPPDVKTIYREADIYLCSSTYEGLSNVILEAMNAGLPVVATDAGDNTRMVSDGVTGYITPTSDSSLLAEKLQELIQDPVKRIEMGKAGYEKCRKDFSLDSMEKRYLNFISQLA